MGRAQAKPIKCYAARAMGFASLYPSYELLRATRRALQQQRVDAAGAAAHRHDARAWLAAGAHFRDLDAIGGQPRPGGVDIGDAPAQAPEGVTRLVGVG